MATEVGVVAECRGCMLTYTNIIRLTDEQLIDCLVSHGVFRDESLCAKCGSPLQLDRRTLKFHCQWMTVVGHKKRAKCNWVQSVCDGTFMSGSHITPRAVVLIIATVLHILPPRQDFIVRNIDVSTDAAVEWCYFTRQVFADHLHRSSEVLGGPGCFVELYDAKLGKRKHNLNLDRRIEWRCVFGGIERGSSKAFFVPVCTPNAETLLDVLQRWVRPGSTIVSDYWKTHNYCMKQERFQHFAVEHSLNFVGPSVGIAENRSRLEVGLPRYPARKGRFISALAEYQFKRKYPPSWAWQERLHYFLKAASHFTPQRR